MDWLGFQKLHLSYFEEDGGRCRDPFGGYTAHFGAGDDGRSEEKAVANM